MEQYLRVMRHHLPAVDRVLLQHQNKLLPAYLNSILKPTDSSYQSRDDLLQVVYDYLKPLLGEIIADQARTDMTRLPLVLTSSHTGIEAYSIFIQGNILFALPALLGYDPKQTVIAFSFGNVPLNTRTYPRGLLIYRVASEYLEKMPVRLPLFPDRLKRIASNCAPPFKESVIDQSLVTLKQMEASGLIFPSIRQTAESVIKEEFLSEDILNLTSYAQQTVVLNNRIWKRLYAAGQSVPELIYIEIESIVRRLLMIDLPNPDSLASRVLFNPTVRNPVMARLDGISGCWHIKNLKKRADQHYREDRSTALDTTGTHFFWWIDERKRKIPLYLESNGAGKPILKGLLGAGKVIEISYSPDIILKHLRRKDLLPSVFSCFLVFALARGVVCIGGCFQSEYLPIIQGAVCKSLIEGSMEEVAREVSTLKTDVYLPGMAGVMARTEKAPYLVPAGIFEILSQGGISSGDVERLSALTVGDAHCGAAYENLSAADPERFGTYQSNWKKALAEDAFGYLSQKVVVK